MTIPFQVKRGLFIFGGGLLLAWILIPGKKKAPKEAEDRKQQKIQANAVLEIVREAIMTPPGISTEDFEALKLDIQQKYGLRVYYQPKDNRYYVADADGKDILRS